MADLTRLIEVMLRNIALLGTAFVAEIDALVARNPELGDEWAVFRPVFVALADTGVLQQALQAALVGALAAAAAGRGPIGKPGHGHHG